MVYDNFFADPKKVRELIIKEEMKDVVASDGVTYPGIVILPDEVKLEIKRRLIDIFGPDFQEQLMFARFSFADMSPPHWAHCDKEMADYVGLIYMNEGEGEMGFGTSMLQHHSTGMELYPQTDIGKKILIDEANYRHRWDETFNFPSRFNRIAILNSDYIHAANGKYGDSKENARLVITVFFKLKEGLTI